MKWRSGEGVEKDDDRLNLTLDINVLSLRHNHMGNC